MDDFKLQEEMPRSALLPTSSGHLPHPPFTSPHIPVRQLHLLTRNALLRPARLTLRDHSSSGATGRPLHIRHTSLHAPPRQSLPSMFDGLSEAQLRAATSSADHPLLIVAGPGAGKTRSITARVQHLLATGVPPARILAITFTCAAAGEMSRRLAAAAGPGAEAICVTTFHSLALLLCRQHGAAAGYADGFVVRTHKQQRKLVERLCAQRRSAAAAAGRPAPAEPAAAALLAAILRAKAQGVGAEACAPPLGEVYSAYGAAMAADGGVDLVDFVRIAAEALERSAAARAAVHARHTHVLVDELQDSSGAQLRFLRLLVPDPPCAQRITAVGDDDQSIYGFQGAGGGLTHFEAAFPHCRRVLLEENYRSTGTLVDAAAALVGHNASRLPKRMRTANAAGARVVVVECRDASCELSHVLRRVRRLVDGGVRRAEIALLVRTARTGGALQRALAAGGVPFNTHAAGHLDAKPVRDLLALLKLLLAPHDDIFFCRVVKAVARTRAKELLLVLENLRDSMDQSGFYPPSAAKLPLHEVARRLRAGWAGGDGAAPDTPQVSPADRKFVCRLVDDLETLTRRLGSLQLSGFLRRCIDLLHNKSLFHSPQSTRHGSRYLNVVPHRRTLLSLLMEDVNAFERDYARSQTVLTTPRPPASPAPPSLVPTSHAVRTPLAPLSPQNESLPQITEISDEALLAFDIDEAIATHYDEQRAEACEAAPPRRVAARGRGGCCGQDATTAVGATLDAAEARIRERNAGRLRAFLDYAEQARCERKAASSEVDADAITLCTIHSSKGLEWSHVFIVHMNEGECPPRGAQGAALEEERRIAFVAVTRAKESLVITHVARESSGEPAVASRFIAEIPPSLIERHIEYS
ncbi:hypothetical protein AB1Y20_009512 [Prymnesium parvum]|uniref:DNA 3'-5' helicase n=1 Tax=Prymnesium parvum TaxID=97485 RepID=A0AB34K597_PRYPA